jgi:hypothetical protein
MKNTITISKKEIKAVIKESVREVLEQELVKLRALALPFVSENEQKDVEKRYGKPSRKITKSVEIKL